MTDGRKESRASGGWRENGREQPREGSVVMTELLKNTTTALHVNYEEEE